MLVHCLPLGLNPVSDDRGGEALPSAPTMWGAIGFSALLFNIYLRPLCDLIHCHRGRHHQYADVTQLYISTPGKLSNGMIILS